MMHILPYIRITCANRNRRHVHNRCCAETNHVFLVSGELAPLVLMIKPWYRHPFRITGLLCGAPVVSPHKGPVVLTFHDFYIVNLNNIFNKQWCSRRFEILDGFLPTWRHPGKSLLIIISIAHGVSMVSCQRGPTRHAFAWQIGPFW